MKNLLCLRTHDSKIWPKLFFSSLKLQMFGTTFATLGCASLHVSDSDKAGILKCNAIYANHKLRHFSILVHIQRYEI